MSGIAGIIHFDGKPVEPGLIEKMTSAMTHRGPDGIHHWVKGSVALGQCMLRTTPESLEEHQPLTNEDESLVLVMDGRVDNWEELRSYFLAQGKKLRSTADAELVLRAYEQWGENAPSHLIGDFAFAVWDARRRRLFCARDIVGNRPFFYAADSDTFLFASELHPLLSDPGRNRGPNIGMVAEYLSVLLQSREETLWRGVMRLPPGEAAVVGAVGLRHYAYWTPPLAPMLRYASDLEYADHLAELLNIAVRARLRSCTPVGAYLSGGLDSSAVAALAARLGNSGDSGAPRLVTFSMVYPGQRCDESVFIDEVNRRIGTSSCKETESFPCLEYYQDYVRTYRDFPEYPTMVASRALLVRAKERGINVILTGYGADEFFSWTPERYRDLLGQRHWRGLLDRLRYDYGKDGLRWLFDKCRSLVSRRRRWVEANSRQFPWITESFVRRTDLLARVEPQAQPLRFLHHSQESMNATLTAGWWVHGREVEERAAARFGIEQRDPFMDRRIIEFALRLPEDQLRRGSFSKFIVRKAMEGVLPDTVTWRRGKAAFDGTFLRALQAVGGLESTLLQDMDSEGWVERAKAREMYRALLEASQHQCDLLPHIFPLWMMFGIGLWQKVGVGQ